jgi:fibronectin type 3 domain-containing protein/pimeloyl-ACP methyl ester carboxylesterase
MHQRNISCGGKRVINSRGFLFLLLFSTLIPCVVADSPADRSAAMDKGSQQLQAPWNFSVIALPDTQFYSQDYPAIFDNQTQWIVNTAAGLNTVFVTHEGDIVNTASAISQWNNANRSMSKLDGNLPWAVLPGNHDGTSVGGTGENLNNYYTYFPRSRFSGQPWYGGAYNNVNSNSFELFSGGADDYLIFHFQYHPSDDVLAWANATIANYPTRRAIVTTHDYMNIDGSRSTEGNHIWNNFVAAHANQIFLVLCGHNHAEARRTDMVNGHAVYQLLADYQEGYPNGGNGWLRILDFRPGEDKIYVKTFSPYVNQYQTDSDSQFTLDYDMTSEQAFVINLESLENETSTMDNMPDFSFTATHISQTTFSCTLWLENATHSIACATKSDVANGSLTTLTPSTPISNGDWSWWINCTDGTASAVSEKRTITISTFRGDKTFTSTLDGSTRTYWLDLPDNFDSSTPTPLVIFLHGYGGSRLSYPQKYPSLRQTFQSNTWIVASVDCRTVSGYQNWYTEPSRRDITDVLNEIRSDYSIDPLHIHVMGNSMGGGGALKYAMFNNWVIASLVDIHGITNFTQFYNENSDYRASLRASYGGTPSQVPTVYANESALGNEQRFSHTPVMMLHGTADDVVSMSQSRYLNQSLNALGYTVEYIEVPGVSHDASILISGREMEIFNWLRDHPLTAPLPNGASFDFGDSLSPVEAGYIQVSNFTAYSVSTGYGWSNTDNLVSRDRGAPDNLRRDLVFGNLTEGTFNFDVQDGECLVTAVIGDQSYMHDQIDIYAEGVLVINDLTALAGSFRETSFRMTIADGQLNLRIVDDGGADPNWVLNALTVVVAPPLPTEAAFDFGTSSSPVETGYAQVTTSTAYSASLGYGWSSTAGLDSRDRGAPDSVRRDLVFSPAEKTFDVDVANGDYLVTLIIGDQNFMHDQINGYVEDALVISHLTALAGSFQEVCFRATITDGQLNLRIVDDGGADPNWVLNTLTVQIAPPLPSEGSFDFGSSSSPIEAGYTQVTSSTAYSASTGYGWSSTVSLATRDRGLPDDLKRDLVFSPTEHTFNVDLANGNYQITVTVGDQSFMHDQIYVYAEDTLVVNDLTVAAGSFQQVTFSRAVSDGQLNLRILDDGGVDPNWVLNALTIQGI